MEDIIPTIVLTFIFTFVISIFCSVSEETKGFKNGQNNVCQEMCIKKNHSAGHWDQDTSSCFCTDFSKLEEESK